MAIPLHQRNGFDPSELVFCAGLQERVRFVPNISMTQFRTLDGEAIGPFIPARSVEVPLWVAVTCKKRRKGKIVCPEWMSIDKLLEVVQLETSESGYSDLPFRWLEISKALLEVASDDIPMADRVRTLLKDIREARQAKSREGLQSLDGIHLETPNLSALEINELRPFFTLAHCRVSQLDPQAEVYEQNSVEQERGTGNARHSSTMSFEGGSTYDAHGDSFMRT